MGWGSALGSLFNQIGLVKIVSIVMSKFIFFINLNITLFWGSYNRLYLLDESGV